ncbi:MAG: 50S ribosomal protein L5 [Candidatus Pacebacteria bacterium]|nr:50S ribosomal protein L5 [Candidatus Paceibacterota bacterium]
MSVTKERQKNIFSEIKERFGYTNVFQSPRIQKVVVSVGTGSLKDKNKVQVIQDRLMKITGQKPSARPAKKSIATFKLREGDIVGYQVTLRGARMNDFLDKLIHIALPRTRDFRGIKRSALDEMGNITIGIKEHTIFPETPDEELRDVFGFAVTITTTARTKEEAAALLENLGFPLQKEES